MAARRSNALKEAEKAIAEAEAQEMRDAQAKRAYAMRLAGKSWWEIAEALELPEAATKDRLADAIRAASALVSEGSKRTLLDMEIARIDHLQASHWTAATESRPTFNADGEQNGLTPPDVRAGEFVLKLIMARVKLQGLEEAGAADVASRTVIVAGTSEEYIAALRQLAGPARAIEGTIERADEETG